MPDVLPQLVGSTPPGDAVVGHWPRRGPSDACGERDGEARNDMVTIASVLPGRAESRAHRLLQRKVPVTLALS